MVCSAFWEVESALRVFKGPWGRRILSQGEQRDICPGLEGFHASGPLHDLGPPRLPAVQRSPRVNLTQMDPHPALNTHMESVHEYEGPEADAGVDFAGAHSELTLRKPLT